MSKIGVVTDSNSSISPQRAKELGVKVLPMPFYIEEECYYENVTLSREDFFEKLITEWWGITLIIVFALAVWLLLSALLYRPFFKRFYDIVLSGLAIIVLSPILLILTILGAIKMKGNPFFTQMRPGKINKRTGEEKIFKLIKFRTMTCEKDENG